MFHLNTIAGAVFQKRKPNGQGLEVTPGPTEPGGDDPEFGLKACAQDLHEAIKTDNIPGIANALKAAFQIFESQPHDEADHSEDSEQGEEQE